jgi:WD40 repeat protein
MKKNTHHNDRDTLALTGCETALQQFNQTMDAILTPAMPLRSMAHLVGRHTFSVTSICVTPDNTRLITGSYDNTARMWDLTTGQCLMVFEGHTDSVHSVCLTPDNTRLITGSYDNTAKFWDLNIGALLGTMYNPKQGFLWTTPPDEHFPHGLFWTDCPERLVHVLDCRQDDSDPRPVTDVEALANHITYHNRRDLVMARISGSDQYAKKMNALLAIRETRQFEKQEKPLMLSDTLVRGKTG